MEIKLYEFRPTRSARVRWTLLEAGLEFETLGADLGPGIIGSDELRKVHPLGKLPAVLIDGRPLFESAAISTYLADQVPQKRLVAPSGTRERALHDQWVSFALTELEAWTWSTAINTFVLPEEKRLPAVFEQNAEQFARGAAALDSALAQTDYLVDDRFSVTDIIVSYSVHSGRRLGLIEKFANLQGYLERLFQRPHCTLSRD